MHARRLVRWQAGRQKKQCPFDSVLSTAAAAAAYDDDIDNEDEVDTDDDVDTDADIDTNVDVYTDDNVDTDNDVDTADIARVNATLKLDREAAFFFARVSINFLGTDLLSFFSVFNDVSSFPFN